MRLASLAHVFALALASSSCALIVSFGEYVPNATLKDGGTDRDVTDGALGMTLPIHPPAGISFRDEDIIYKSISGTITLAHATDESDVTAYNLYWGTDEKTKLRAITSIPKTKQTLSYLFAEPTPVPAGATHFLAFTANEAGEMRSGLATPCDRYDPANYSPLSLKFVDEDLRLGMTRGLVTIGKPIDDREISGFNLYWGSGETTKLSAIGSVSKMGAESIYSLAQPDGGSLPVPQGATHLLVISQSETRGELGEPFALTPVDRVQ